MIKLPIQPGDIEEAKAMTKKFDEIKSYNKFQCDNNYLGYLGEKILNDYLSLWDINYKWIGFVKKSWKEPDFTFGKWSVDLKTTFDQKMWIQKAKFDIYIFSRVNESVKDAVILVSFITRKKLQRLIDSNKLEKVKKETKEFYVVPVEHMTPIEKLLRKIGVECQ